MTFDEIQSELEKCDKGFINQLFYELLLKEKVNFNDLSNRYVAYLEKNKKDDWQLTVDLAYSLMHHRYPDVVGGKTKEDRLNFINSKAIDALKKTKLFPEELDYTNGVAEIYKTNIKTK